MNITFRADDQEAELTVDDNGTGFPTNFDPETMSNHGLEMACHLARLDLSGSIAFETRKEGGGRVSVKMPRFAQAQCLAMGAVLLTCDEVFKDYPIVTDW